MKLGDGGRGATLWRMVGRVTFGQRSAQVRGEAGRQLRQSIPGGGNGLSQGPRCGTEDSLAGAKSAREGSVGLVTTAARTLAVRDAGSARKVSVHR